MILFIAIRIRADKNSKKLFFVPTKYATKPNI